MRMNTEFIKKGLQKHEFSADVVIYSSKVLSDNDGNTVDDISILEKYDAILMGVSIVSM